MNRRRINRIGFAVPVIFSVLALADVLVARVTGWERHLTDEGAGAHIFQLLIVAQIPFVIAFLATAQWSKVRAVAGPLALQAAALLIALSSLALFHL